MPIYNAKIVLGEKYMYFNNLKKVRNDKDITQEEIAKILKVNRSTYKNWENGIVMIPIEIADELSIFYNVRLSYILGLECKKKLDVKIEKMKYDVLLKNLSVLKKENHNSYEEIGTYIGCAKSTCQRYFNGIVKIPMDRLILLAALYDIDLDKLCGKE